LRHDFSGIAGTEESMEAASVKTGLLTALPVRGGGMTLGVREEFAFYFYGQSSQHTFMVMVLK
jgi:hypothetical protein